MLVVVRWMGGRMDEWKGKVTWEGWCSEGYSNALMLLI